ncbi:MAG TPA: DUF4258 domain-containing protein [Patescibacteria group bacterium]|nr:DUF4258 domain-containing protein [Patescibacteria group bacterium]
MSIEFSDHAVEQVKSRKIPRKRVIDTIKKPQKKIESFKNRMLRQRQFGSKILEAVTITEGSKITVITVYYLEENED